MITKNTGKGMQYTVYIYSQTQNARELNPFRCPSCGRILFRSNSKKILISNAYGASYLELPPSSNFIEIQCHGCKALYNILYQ